MPVPNPSLPVVPAGLHVEVLTLDAAGLTLDARAIAAEAPCPVCGHASERLHSRYWRTIGDLPWHDRAVTWRVRVRRFRCGRCPGRVFAERLPGLAGAKARRSGRSAEAQTDIGMALGGEAGARLSRRLAMPVSGDTVLRLVRRRPPPPCPAPLVVGIDDWAWRRGRAYGTIVCDLERRRVVDLLPGRSAAPVREWLAAHPGLAVVSRDRAGPYAEAARARRAGRGAGRRPVASPGQRFGSPARPRGAQPSAGPRRRRPIAPSARPRAARPGRCAIGTGGEPSTAGADRRCRAPAHGGRHHQGHRPPHRRGPQRRAPLAAGEFVPYRRAPGPSLLDRHLPFAEERWRAGLRNGVELHRALRARGFGGGYDIVRRWVAGRRRERGAPARPPSCSVPSTRRTTRLLTTDPASLSTTGRRFVDALLASAPAIRAAAEHVRAFADLVRRREPAAFDAWLGAAPGIANPVFAPILAGAEAVLAARGYALPVADPGDDPGRAAALADGMASRRVDGLLLATAAGRDDPVVSRRLARGTPVVLINRAEAEPRAPSVVSYDREGMRLAVGHLAGLGHRRIGHVAGPPSLSTGDLRRRGFEAAVSERGLDAGAAVEPAAAYTREAGAEAARRLLARRPDLTALACANDLLALGAYDAAAAPGLRVPGDVSVTGHNDMPLVGMVAPPPTTVRIGHAELGREAAHLLLRAMEDRAAPPARGAAVLLRPELVVRASTAAPRPG